MASHLRLLTIFSVVLFLPLLIYGELLRCDAKNAHILQFRDKQTDREPLVDCLILAADLRLSSTPCSSSGSNVCDIICTIPFRNIAPECRIGIDWRRFVTDCLLLANESVRVNGLLTIFFDGALTVILSSVFGLRLLLRNESGLITCS